MVVALVLLSEECAGAGAVGATPFISMSMSSVVSVLTWGSGGTVILERGPLQSDNKEL